MNRSLPALVIAVASILSILAADVSAAVVTEGRIREIVKTHIEKNMPWAPGALRIEILYLPTDQQFKGQKITWQVQGRLNEAYIGESFFNVRFYDGEVFCRQVPVRVRMEAAMDVVVSARPLPRDTVLGPDDVKVVKKWFNRAPRDILSDPEEAIGKNIAAPVRINEEITRAMLKTPRIVKKGSLVRILAESDALVISTMGLSEDNGSRGEIIRVKNLTSNKIVYAKIINEALVRVEF
jgi:flagella basal body P-ring formation protein FlgA